MRRIRVHSATMAVDVNTLRLTVDEYKCFRAEDAEMIKRLRVKIKYLTAAARDEIEVTGPIDAAVKDTLVVQDTVPVLRQKGEIRVPVTLRQAVWIEYKRRWIFWKRVKAVHQTTSSNNPYVEIRYSEYVQMEK